MTEKQSVCWIRKEPHTAVRKKRWMNSQDNFPGPLFSKGCGCAFLHRSARVNTTKKKWLQLLGSGILKCVLHVAASVTVRATAVTSFCQGRKALSDCSLRSLLRLCTWSRSCEDRSQGFVLIITKDSQVLVTLGSANLLLATSKGTTWPSTH